MENQKLDEILVKIAVLESRTAEIWKSVEKTRKYFLWTLIASLIFFILPIIGLLFAVPAFLGALTSLSDLGL